MPSFYIKGVAIFRVQYLTATELARCLKFINKVSFNIASEASYVYYATSQFIFNRTKIGGKCQNWKCDIFSNFKQCVFTGLKLTS